MKKIGFIDYFLNEWHANNYPQFIKNACGDEFKVCYAYGKIDANGMTNKEWAEKYDVELLNSIEELIEKSDCIIVLSPDNPEMHEELCFLPLQSQKLVYVDKTFAPTKEVAKRIFANADEHNTKCFSSSALNFSSELQEFDRDKIQFIASQGPGSFEVYSIHQIEPIVNLMGAAAKRVMFTGDKMYPSLVIEFENGKRVQMCQVGGETPFTINVGYNDGTTKLLEIKSDYFANFIKEMLDFFRTGEIKVAHSQTINVIAIREAGMKALKQPFTWVEV